jgi:hypothetical protein
VRGEGLGARGKLDHILAVRIEFLKFGRLERGSIVCFERFRLHSNFGIWRLEIAGIARTVRVEGRRRWSQGWATTACRCPVPRRSISLNIKTGNGSTGRVGMVGSKLR